MWAPAFPEVSMKGVALATEQSMDLLYKTNQISSYDRLQVDLDEAVLDDPSPQSLEKLKAAAHQLMKKPVFEDLVNRLIKRYNEGLNTVFDKIIRSPDCLDLSLHNITGGPMTMLVDRINRPAASSGVFG